METQEQIRRRELNRMSKGTLIDIYRRGVRQADGRVIASLGSARELGKWSKAEIVNSLLEINWPGWPERPVGVPAGRIAL